jgi:hypothetical protein
MSILSHNQICLAQMPHRWDVLVAYLNRPNAISTEVDKRVRQMINCTPTLAKTKRLLDAGTRSFRSFSFVASRLSLVRVGRVSVDGCR